MKNPMHAVLLPLALILGAASACHPVNTIPPPPSPSDPVKHYDLEIPEALEIKAVSFDATAFSDVSGTGNMTSTQMGGRAFLKVYAVHRQTGEQYLLIYEDIAHRKTPVQVIRFRAVPDSRVLAPGTPTIRSGASVDSLHDTVPSGQVLVESVVDEKPEIVSGPPLVYPDLLRQAGIEGLVMVQVIIDSAGRAEPASVKVIQTANPGFNQSAMNYVIRSVFRPARLGGRAVRVLMNLPIDFNLHH